MNTAWSESFNLPFDLLPAKMRLWLSVFYVPQKLQYALLKPMNAFPLARRAITCGLLFLSAAFLGAEQPAVKLDSTAGSFSLREQTAPPASISASQPLSRRIDTWLACGTFANANEADFNADVIDEKGVSPAEGMNSGGKPWRIFDDRLYCRNLDDYNDLYTFYGSIRRGSPSEPTDSRLAYVHTYVWSPGERKVYLRLGANDGYRVWLNGEMIGEHPSRMQRAFRDREVLPASLAKGWNRLLLKVGNAHGVWGFYAAFADGDGQPLNGLAYSLTAPGGALAMETQELPDGYQSQPYVWLQVTNVPPSPQTPSASPFRLRAHGGTPPYRWAFAVDRAPPPGLWLDGVEGELHGVCAQAGRFPVCLQVTDAAGAIVRTTLFLDVHEPPTRWLERARIGGLLHSMPNIAPPLGDPERQARQMAQEGYGYATPNIGWWVGGRDWPGKYADETEPASPTSVAVPNVATPHPKWYTFDGSNGWPTKFTLRNEISGDQDVSAYADAFRRYGVRFGVYVGMPHPLWYLFPDNDFTLWPRFLDFLHAHVETMCVKYSPDVLYLDGIVTRGKDLLDGPRKPMDWDLDPLYSLVKTRLPECVVMANSSGDNASGDADVINVEGNNDAPPYWDRWPQGTSGRNPKSLPVASWRYPFAWRQWEGMRVRAARFKDEPDYLDWQEWCRVVVSLIAEGFIADLDHSYGFERDAMHDKIGAWMQPRLQSLVGTRPGLLEHGAWGYDVVRDSTIYLHLLKNGRGKTGWTGGRTVAVGSLPGRVMKAASFPDGKPLAFRQQGQSLTIEMTGVDIDPVDTIIAIELGKEKEHDGP
jgi:hypothetical protein